jgi:two-component system response regulator AtoC
MPADTNGLTVVVAEEDLDVRNYLETALRCQGYSVEVAQNGEEVLSYLQHPQTAVSAVVLDVFMPGRDGIGALREIRRLNQTLPVIVISDASSPLDVVEAMKNGADDFISKPINPEDLRKSLKKAIGSRPPALANLAVQTALPASDNAFSNSAPAMRELESVVPSVGWSDAPVLIHGETGAGKEVLARQLHACSPRAKRPMLKLNCAALPSELVESELFGYERGAFTGAFQRKLGMFELANGGTILLDEIGDMDFKLQAKLLQVLQDHEFQRLGGKDTVRVDVRIIAATHRNLEKAIAESRFREDLYYRLNVVSLSVPPLRERKEDIIALADFFIRKHAVPGATTAKIPPSLQELFLEHQWPGNIRELENVVRRFLIFPVVGLVEQYLRGRLVRDPAHESVTVAAASAPEPLQIDVPVAPPNAANRANGANGIHGPNGSNNGANGTNGCNEHVSCLPERNTPVLVQVAHAKREAERVAILEALRATNWNRRKASIQLQTDYKSLLYKMKVLSIKKENVAPDDTGSRAMVAGSKT